MLSSCYLCYLLCYLAVISVIRTINITPGLNWIDIVSITPFYIRLIARNVAHNIEVFRILKLVRLVRVMKLLRHSAGTNGQV